MHNLIKENHSNGDDDEDGTADSTPVVTDAVSRLPSYIRDEVLAYVRAEAIKRRDPAFSHCSTEFLLALVASLRSKTLLLTGDYFIKDTEKIPDQVIFVEKGRLEVVLNGKCTRTLQRGDVIGKRWLLSAGTEDNDGGAGGETVESSFSTRTSLRAHSSCILVTGLSDPCEVVSLRMRYETDFALVKADRERVCEMRLRRDEDQRNRLRKSAEKVMNVMRMSSLSTHADSDDPAETEAEVQRE